MVYANAAATFPDDISPFRYAVTLPESNAMHTVVISDAIPVHTIGIGVALNVAVISADGAGNRVIFCVPAKSWGRMGRRRASYQAGSSCSAPQKGLSIF